MADDPLSTLEIPWYRTPFFERWILLALPPLGLLLVWTDFERTRGRKIFISIFTGLWLIPYLALLLLGAIGLDLLDLEFKGGNRPSIVRHRSGPDYLALEENRRLRRAEDDSRAPATNLTAQASSVAPAQLPPYWTNFRGPSRDGHYDERPILTDWPIDGPPRLWRQPGGGGYASFVVAEGLAFTIEQRRDQETVVAYELDTGREVWTSSYGALFSEWMGGDGPRATPTYHDGFLYSLGATGELRCLSASLGTVLWRRNVLADTGAENLPYGLACSPLVLGRSVIVLSGQGANEQAVVAYDTLSGDRLWATLSDPMAYTSPALVELAGRPQLLLTTARRVLGLDPDTRAVLWDYRWEVPYNNAIAMPVLVGTNQLLISAGYGVGAALLEIRALGNAFEADTLWRNRNLKNKFNSSVFWQGHFYGLDEGVLACVHADSGARVWRDGRYQYGQLLLAQGHLLVLAGDGQLALVEATPRAFVEKHRLPALNGKTWNVPALAHGRLLLRNASEMTCFDLRPRRTDNPAP
jgi:outer membrane protein assembly factor BamB